MAYGNRTDLNNAVKQTEFTGQQYGQASQQRRSQQMVPTGPPPGEVEVTPLGAPSGRPDEPVTAGVPMGAGPGLEALQGFGVAPGSRDDLMVRLRAIASRYPNPTLLALMHEMETRR
jgi:hypothetical protein